MIDGLEMHNLLGTSAALSAAMQTGLVDAIFRDQKTADEHARDLSLDARATRRVLDVLVAFGAATCDGDRYGASPALRTMVEMSPLGVEQVSALWNHLPEALRSGRPLFDMDASPAKREAVYAKVVTGLARMFAPAAQELASKIDGTPKRILDVGCGSGVWSLAIADRFTDARVTGLDLPDVLVAFDARARELGLESRVATIPGDMHEVVIPPGAFDLVIIANVLRLETPDRARHVVERAASGVAPGGRLLVVDAFSDGSPKSEQALRIYALHLTLRTKDGRIYEARDVKSWMAAAGLVDASDIAVAPHMGAIGAVTATKTS